MTDPASIAADAAKLRAECDARHANCSSDAPCFLLRAAAALERVESALPEPGTVEDKRLEEAVAHAVGRDAARCALAALRAALAPPAQESA
jgi:hypothetical protein